MENWHYIGITFGVLAAMFELVSAPFEWLWPFHLGGNTIWRGNKSTKTLSLTFDDGPSKYTGGILDILKAHNIPATFFVRGSQAVRFPHLIKRMVAEGHQIGNHLYSFDAKRSLKKLYYPFREDEVTQTQIAIENLTGIKPQYFRSPGAQMGRNLWKSVRDHNLVVVYGAIPFPTPEDAPSSQLKTILPTLKPGTIIILHDGDDHDPDSDRPRLTLELLPELITELNSRDFKVISIEENAMIKKPIESIS
jgi:peptidoglycan/xylan/chitin deacetylase (PgdA/CDA1 family)